MVGAVRVSTICGVLITGAVAQIPGLPMREGRLKNKTDLFRGARRITSDMWAGLFAIFAAVLFVIYMVTIGP